MANHVTRSLFLLLLDNLLDSFRIYHMNDVIFVFNVAKITPNAAKHLSCDVLAGAK